MHRPSPNSPRQAGATSRAWARRAAALVLGPALAILAGCGVSARNTTPASTALSISPGISSLDTNCTGCNAISSNGDAVQQFSAVLPTGAPAEVTWSIEGGDPASGAGKLDAKGRYTPPGYLTADHAEVLVTAHLVADARITANARLTITPGFLQPLTPENAAVGPGGSITFTGKLAAAGGQAGIRFGLSGSNAGTLSPVTCDHARDAFTTCTVTYTAPAVIANDVVVHITATSSGASAASRTEAAVLLNSEALNSSPVAHQQLLPTLMPLGGSGGNNSDYDSHGNTIADCCSGTLGALLEDNAGRQYILSNNHVLAKSDRASIGDPIVQPGLIDNNCTPNGSGPGTVPVANLSAWLPLKSPQTNADAAIAQVGSRTVDHAGSILELGARQPDGTLAAAAPGISSTGGHGEPATLQMRVAKSGRTTGLTCGAISAIDLDVAVDYYSDCAETHPYLTKIFTSQMAISGNRFSDAGDSGALIVDTADGEPVGLFFAGGTDAAGVGQGVANPAPEVLTELASAVGNGASFTFAGTADHPVSCLHYGNSTARSAQAAPLSDAEIARGQQALFAARSLVNPAAGIFGVSMGKSIDHAGEAAVLIYINEASQPRVPASIEGVRTVVIPATLAQVALGTAALDNGSSPATPLAGPQLSHALRVKQQNARALMRRNPGIFGVGVGQSLDDPHEPAIVIYIDRNRMPKELPQSIAGVRTRYVLMDRLHVTRSYATGVAAQHSCAPAAASSAQPDSNLTLPPVPISLP